MTGFGCGNHSIKTWSASVEINSVNRKQLEVITNFPRNLIQLEAKTRDLVATQLSRGRIQISLVLSENSEASGNFHIDESNALALEKSFKHLSQVIGRPVEPSASDFLRQPDVITKEETEAPTPEFAWKLIQPALEKAIANLVEMRATEGKHLSSDILSRLSNLKASVETIEQIAPFRSPKQKELLIHRLAELKQSVSEDDERLAKEIAIFADKCDISEEITRLHSHFEKFISYAQSADPNGRSLDFLCQELFREFNTIASKANDASIAQNIVSAKAELERIREQIQNIE